LKKLAGGGTCHLCPPIPTPLVSRMDLWTISSWDLGTICRWDLGTDRYCICRWDVRGAH
jgi:hypothetical protein